MIKFHPGTKRNIFLEKYRSKAKGALPDFIYKEKTLVPWSSRT
jgi:hypothetical protein